MWSPCRSVVHLFPGTEVQTVPRTILAFVTLSILSVLEKKFAKLSIVWNPPASVSSKREVSCALQRQQGRAAEQASLEKAAVCSTGGWGIAGFWRKEHPQLETDQLHGKEHEETRQKLTLVLFPQAPTLGRRSQALMNLLPAHRMTACGRWMWPSSQLCHGAGDKEAGKELQEGNMYIFKAFFLDPIRALGRVDCELATKQRYFPNPRSVRVHSQASVPLLQHSKSSESPEREVLLGADWPTCELARLVTA